jgi:hypothetical protein
VRFLVAQIVSLIHRPDQVGKWSPTGNQDSLRAEAGCATALVVKKRREPPWQLGPVKQAAPHLDHHEAGC